MLSKKSAASKVGRTKKFRRGLLLVLRHPLKFARELATWHAVTLRTRTLNFRAKASPALRSAAYFLTAARTVRKSESQKSSFVLPTLVNMFSNCVLLVLVK